MSQLAVVLGAAAPGGLSGVRSDKALAVVEAVEAIKAWADSVSVAATATMTREFETEWVHLAPEEPSTWGWTRFVRHCRSAAAREIQVATGLPISQCQRRVWLASCEPERSKPLTAAMRAGRVTLTRALTLAEATAHLDAAIAAGIATRVLRPLTSPDGTLLPAAPLSQATFRARLHRQLVLHHGLTGQAKRTYQEGLKARRMSAEPHPDGTGGLLITGDGPRICAAHSRVDQIARRLRNEGDPRTLDQLRADVATNLLLHGCIPGDSTFAAHGGMPAATVQVVVSLSTLLGLDKGAAVIPGWGTISGQQARRLALAAGSIWKRIVTDPLTGRAIEATATTYKVPAGMAEQVKIRDGVCRAPGCEIPATRADLDHTQEWQPGGAGGSTAETNLATLHRGHHNLKTAGFWDSVQSPDGTLTWTTATGRTITTHPHIYDHPDNLPITASPLETHLGTRLAHVLNPAIPLPGHISIFDEVDWARKLTPSSPQVPQYHWSPQHQGSPQHVVTTTPVVTESVAVAPAKMDATTPAARGATGVVGAAGPRSSSSRRRSELGAPRSGGPPPF
jgi:hypothetical protein